MQAAASKTRLVIARVVVALIVVLLLAGLIWYGVSTEVRQRAWQDLVRRPGETMAFRFILQPAMAVFMGVKDGLEDSRLGRTPYLWTLVFNPSERVGRLREGVVSTARIIILGLGMDVMYQVLVLKTFYPGEAAIVAIVLAFLPYLLIRGPVARLSSRRRAALGHHQK